MPESSQELHQLLQLVADVMFPANPEQEVHLESRGYDGDTALHVFLWQCDDAAAKVLVGAGADVNAQGEMGETPLHVAARNAKPETIAAILLGGGRPDVVSEFGQTPSDLARENGRQHIWEEALLLAKRKGPRNA